MVQDTRPAVTKQELLDAQKLNMEDESTAAEVGADVSVP